VILVSQPQPVVLYHVEDMVAVITLNRPEKLNALNRECWVQLDVSFARADQDPNVRAIALVAAGRSFSAGADLGPGEDPTELLPWLGIFQRHHERQFRMWNCGKVIVAGINGYAIGRDLELALWCDIVIASEDAKLGQPEVREGWVVGSVVPWLTGPQQAKLFMLSGDIIGAHDAERLGLVARVVATGNAASEAVKLARRLAHVPLVTARAVKAMINGVYEQLGIKAQQQAAIAISAATSAMTPKEKGTEELERIRREEGLKASIKFRDTPFDT
jgi:enoyl-CoA hydratase/carnithine racemase